MRLASYFFTACVLTMSFTGLHADGTEAFTGKITRDKVRLRLEASLDSTIIRQVDRDDLFIVTGMVDDFYQVAPPSDIKAFVYRTFVLDGVIEGDRVNVRLEPSLESPVIAQMNRGELIDGKISPLNNKWMEFTPPKGTHFYVASEYIEKIGKPDYLETIERRQEEANRLIQTTSELSNDEFDKSYPEMNLETVFANYNQAIEEYNDFPKYVERAQELLTRAEEDYIHRKLDYLENQKEASTRQLRNENVELSEKMTQQNQDLVNLKVELEEANRGKSATQFYQDWLSRQSPETLNSKMRVWIPMEISLYEKWGKKHRNKSINDFYKEQKRDAVALRGIIQAYNRPIRNKPGDYVLVNKSNNLPIAYLYSTQVNLDKKLGQEVSVEAVIRPNNHFAYPAYFIMSAE